MAKQLPCATKLRILLAYEDETGRLHWKCRVNQGVYPGDVAGRKSERRRYITLKIRGQEYQAHRVIWKIKTGCEPPEHIDHIDCNALNNRWSNLRAATMAQNMRNKRLQRNNRSGAKGVHWNQNDERWKVTIRVDRKDVYLGCFQNKDEAVAVANAARSNLHGEFARFA